MSQQTKSCDLFCKHQPRPHLRGFSLQLLCRLAMDTLARVFGKGNKGEPPSPQQAIQKLRQTEEMLSKKSEHIEVKIQRELAAAKKNGMKNKPGK